LKIIRPARSVRRRGELRRSFAGTSRRPLELFIGLLMYRAASNVQRAYELSSATVHRVALISIPSRDLASPPEGTESYTEVYCVAVCEPPAREERSRLPCVPIPGLETMMTSHKMAAFRLAAPHRNASLNPQARMRCAARSVALVKRASTKRRRYSHSVA
jgi:hypothetical protein